MKKFFGVILLIVSMIVVMYMYYTYQRITALPEWYRSEKKPENTANAVYYRQQDLLKMKNKIDCQKTHQPILQNSSSFSDTILLNAEQLHEQMIEKLLNQTGNDSLLLGVQATYLNIDNDVIRTGAVVNFKRLLHEEKLNARMEKLISFLPFSENQEVHVSIVSKPVIQNDFLSVDSAAVIQIGTTEWSIDELASLFNKDPGKIRKFLRLQLR